jgi:hypothetical protein
MGNITPKGGSCYPFNCRKPNSLSSSTSKIGVGVGIGVECILNDDPDTDPDPDNFGHRPLNLNSKVGRYAAHFL